MKISYPTLDAELDTRAVGFQGVLALRDAAHVNFHSLDF